MFFSMFDFIFGFLDMFPPAISIGIFAILIAIITNLCYKFLTDQLVVTNLKADIKKLRDKMKEHQKNGDAKKANEHLAKIMNLNSKLMMSNIKPMIVSFGLVILLFPWLGHKYGEVIVMYLPITIPLIGNTIGWLVWYIILSIPLSFLFRKILRVKM